MSVINFIFPEVPQFNFLIDLQGESLYQKWLSLGNVGTESDFLNWLKVGSGGIDGTLTANYIPSATGSKTLGNSNLFTNGANTGIGVKTPVSPLHISTVDKAVNAALYSTDYVTFSGEGTSRGINFISAGDGAGFRGVVKGTKSRGTLDAPTVPLSGDNAFSVLSALYDGVTNLSTAGVLFEVDGTVSAGVAPQRILFATSAGASRIERMRITSDGKVGIGTTTPSALFTVRATAVPSAAEAIAQYELSDDPNSYLRIKNGTNADSIYVPSIEGKNSSVYTSLFFMGTATTDTGTVPITVFDSRLAAAAASVRPLFQWNNYSSPVMTMAANGNLGVGTTSPTSKLHVNGDVNIATILNATTNTDKILVSDGGVIKYRTAAEILSDQNIPIIRKTASYVGVASDNGKLIEMNVATANTFTINTGVYSVGNQILVSQYGAGQTTITAGAGITIRSNGNKFKTSGQYALATLLFISSTECYLSGTLTV